jgi:hypothetical protein
VNGGHGGHQPAAASARDQPPFPITAMRMGSLFETTRKRLSAAS